MDVLDFFAAVGFNVNLDKDHHLIFLSGDGCRAACRLLFVMLGIFL